MLSELKKEKYNQFNHRLIVGLEKKIQVMEKTTVRRKTIIIN